MSETQTSVTSQDTKTVGLNLQDLLLMVQTIQIVSQRGAFKAEELSTVGGMYERLVDFLKSNGAIKEQEAAPETTENEK